MNAIHGNITPALDAMVPLMVRGPANQQLDITAILDTGFNGQLGLMPEQIEGLGLRFITTTEVELGDGSTTLLPKYLGRVHWLDGIRTVTVIETESSPLLGMAMLLNCDVTLQVVPSGRIEIRKHDLDRAS